MKTKHVAQLPDGRWVRIRELTSKEQATAFTLAASGSPGGTPNPVLLDRECIMLALDAVTDPLPLYETAPDGKAVPETLPDGKPKRYSDGSPALRRLSPASIPDNAWKPLAYGALSIGDTYDDTFGPKARQVLATLYAKAHACDEVERDFFGTIRTAVVSG